MTSPAVTVNYFSTEEYRSGIEKPDPSSDIDIAEDATTVCDFLDQITGRHFTKDPAVVTRYFYAEPDANGLAQRILRPVDQHRFGDIATAVGVVVKTDDDGDGTAETTWAAGDYQLRPLNALVGRRREPYTELYVPTTSTKAGWPLNTLISVAAIWGWNSVPAGIKRAGIQLCGIWRLESPRASRTINDLQQVVSTSRVAQDIVNDVIMAFHPTGIVVA